MRKIFKSLFIGVAAAVIILSSTGAATASVGTDKISTKSEVISQVSASNKEDVTRAIEPLASYPAKDILAWGDGGARNYPIRRGYWNGSKGFGYDKTYHKHNIWRLKTISWIMGSTNSSWQGTQYVTNAYAQKLRCNSSGSSCVIDQEVPVRSVTETAYKSSYYGQIINGRLGLMTAYCVTGQVKCPSWVNNIPKLMNSDSSGEDVVYKTGISYEQLGKGTRVKESDLEYTY